MSNVMTFWNPTVGEPWAMIEPALNSLLTMATWSEESIQAILAKPGRDVDGTWTTQARDGVAIVPVVGPLFRYNNFLTMMGWASSYETLAKDFTASLDNSDIHSIVLDIDSPGGEVNGCAELATLIYEARSTKPIIAYVSGDAASGAYWIASACDEIIASETSMLGSIGVVAVYRGNNDEKRVEIVSSQSPHKRLDPNSDDGKSRLQSRIDDLATVFIESVARHRGVDPPTVVENFGGGDVLIGKHAVTQGLADRLGSLEKTITRITPIENPAQQRGSSFVTLEENTMTEKTNNPEATSVQTFSVETLKAEYPQLVESIQAEGRSEALQEGIDQGCRQERERIGAIIGADATKGREQLAQHLAFFTDMAADMVLVTLEAAPVTAEVKSLASNTGFEQVMTTISNPAIEPDTGETDEDSADTIAKRIAQFSQGGVA
jgi:signal peptide peptidase SppA